MLWWRGGNWRPGDVARPGPVVCRQGRRGRHCDFWSCNCCGGEPVLRIPNSGSGSV
jgi:hypothetical protein